MAGADPTNEQGSEVQEIGPAAPTTDVEGTDSKARLLWLAAGVLFAAAGVIWLVTSATSAVGVLFLVVAMTCVALSAGYARRR